MEILASNGENTSGRGWGGRWVGGRRVVAIDVVSEPAANEHRCDGFPGVLALFGGLHARAKLSQTSQRSCLVVVCIRVLR